MKKIVYVGGTFDCPHYGHINLLKKAKELGDILIVAVNRDEFVTRFKRKPVMTLNERMAVISELKGVDKCVINKYDEDTASMLLKYIPDFVVYGSDYTEERYKKQIGVTDTFLKATGVQLVQVPYTEGISTTELIKRVKNIC